LRKRLSTLNERFSALAESLAQTARQLQISGSLPPESLLDEINKVRADFGDVRHRVLDAARALALNSPAMSEIDSIKALEPALEDTVTQAFGRALAVAATRGKLLVGGPAPAAPERPAQPAPKAAEPAVKPAAPTPPSAPPRPEPVIVGTGTPVAPPLKTPGPSEHVHVNAAAPAPAQAVEQATQDEAAQWWVSAWARWTSWRGTLSFVDAVQEELGKYNYVLSVPIQKSTDYED